MMFNKKYIWITLFFSIFSIALGFAQDKNRFQAIENEKIAYITKELDLTPERLSNSSRSIMSTAKHFGISGKKN